MTPDETNDYRKLNKPKDHVDPALRVARRHIVPGEEGYPFMQLGIHE